MENKELGCALRQNTRARVYKTVGIVMDCLATIR